MKGLATACGVTTRAVSAWEGGDAEPRPTVRRQLAEVLDFPESFFERDDPPELKAESVSFRALTAMTARERDQALAAGALAFELSAWLDQHFSAPQVDLPAYGGVSAEAAAEMLRAAWGLGDRPARNIIHLVESRGVRVFSLVEGTRRLDAYATWHDHTPFAFLNTTKSAERGRFDMAHELGHLVLHQGTETIRNRACEVEADRFGGAFLMPSSGLFARTPRRATLDWVMSEKQYWQVPAMALVYRLHELQLLSEWHYRSYCIELTKLGYRLDEPDGQTNESSLLLAKIFSLLREQRVGRNAVADAVGIKERELDQLVFGLTLNGVEGGHERSERPRGHLKSVSRSV